MSFRLPKRFYSFTIRFVLLLSAATLFAAGFAYRHVVADSISTGLALPDSDPRVGLIPSPTPTPEILHTLVGSYYLTNENIESKLLLNNKGNLPLDVRPTLYNKQGLELAVAPVVVEPQSFRFINISDWASLGGDGFRAGNVKLMHYGKDLVLGAQMYLTDAAHSISYEEKFSELGKFNSKKQEAVVWMPSSVADVRVVLTNTTDAILTVTGRLAKKPNIVSDPQSLTLQPHATKTIDLRDEFPGSSTFLNSNVVALSLEHSGANDALLARALVSEKTKGYSNVVQFSNPDGGKSSEYQGVGFQIEDIANHSMQPVIVARNVGTAPATVTVNVPYTRGNGTRGNIALIPEQLASGEMRALNVQKIVQRASQEQIKVASLEVTYDTAPGSVIVATHSVSPDHDDVFRVPMWDPLGQRSPTGGYPWRIEGTSVTETYIKNITDVDEDYVAFLVWENGGMYMIGRKSIKAHETIHIDVKKLRDEQSPDERGRTIPQNLNSGQLQWTLERKDNLPDEDTRASLALIGRSEQVDLQNGIVNNYACQNCCAGSHVYGFIFPASQEIEYGESAHFISVNAEETCYGFPYEFTVAANWTSSNGDLGPISGGDITPSGAGQSNIGASWNTHTSFANPCPPGGGSALALINQNDQRECGNGNRGRSSGPNAAEPESNINLVGLFSPACGECVWHSFIFIPPVATLVSKPKVKKLQYQEPGSGSFIDISGTLFVLKGTSVTFKALPDPSNSSFPSGQPTWSGSSGATGVGQTISVTFNSLSSNSSDYKTVSAIASNGGSAKTANVVIYELTAKITPEDNYVPTPPQQARSLTDFGLKEVVGFGFTASPNVTAAQAGGLQWSVQTGIGTIPTPPRIDGIAVYTAPYAAESSRLKLEVLNGPSKGNNITYDITIVAPANGYLVSTSNIERTMGDFGGSFKADFYLEPRNVSFYNLYFSEGPATPVADGYLSYFSAYPHAASPSPAAINACIAAIGCNKVAGNDTVTTRTSPAALPRHSVYVGDVMWSIPWLYHASGSGVGTQFTIADHHCASNNIGTATLSKKGAGPFTIAIGDPTSTY